ncbi:MAG: phenylacetate--CoA ligase family protein [Pseudomonadota bacterium]
MPPNYFEAMNYDRMVSDYPAGDAFVAMAKTLSRDELFTRQDAAFRKTMAFAWTVPFYKRLWSSAGIEPGDVRGLADIAKLPVYDKSDLMRAVEEHPPIGDFSGLETYPADSRPPLIFQTTSGTTGRPQPLLFGPRSRELQNLLLSRIYALQGLSRQDVVHSVYGHGMVNGGHYVREAITHWVGCQMLTAGTGVETRSVNQVQLMRDFGVTAIIGFGDYIKRLAQVARENGIEPGRDIKVRMISGHMGTDAAAIGEAWGGAEIYDWYGVGDTGAIAGEGPDHDGLYVIEDAQYLELLDVDTQAPVADGTIGDMVVTCLYKDDVYPIIRFNTHDVSEAMTGASSIGLKLKRIKGFLGRSDNMVKLRGINIYPQAIGTIMTTHADALNGEYICEVTTDGQRDEMRVHAECRAPDPGLAERLEGLLRERLGVAIAVTLAAPNALADLTQIETRQKPIRLIDRRKDG